MSKNLITVIPKTRINDLFVDENLCLNFSPIDHNYKDPIIQGQPNIDHRFLADFYKKIGVDIVVETAMHYPYNFITEKTYRPIANGRPFFVIGPLGSLAFLKTLGFLTFSSIIDESYDNIINPTQRFVAVCQSILNFVNRPLDEIIKDVSSIECELIHNQQWLEQLVHIQFEDFKKQIKIDPT